MLQRHARHRKEARFVAFSQENSTHEQMSLLAAALVSEKTLIRSLDKSFELLAIKANRALSPKLHS